MLITIRTSNIVVRKRFLNSIKYFKYPYDRLYKTDEEYIDMKLKMIIYLNNKDRFMLKNKISSREYWLSPKRWFNKSDEGNIKDKKLILKQLEL